MPGTLPAEAPGFKPPSKHSCLDEILGMALAGLGSVLGSVLGMSLAGLGRVLAECVQSGTCVSMS